MATIIDICDLRVWGGRQLILDGVSWRVKRGEHWVILGANGSGKTSLLNTLTAYLTPGGGKVEVLGQIYGKSNWRELRKHIGIVSSSLRQLIPPQETAMETILSGKEAMIGMWGKSSTSERRDARKLLRQIECEYLEERPWRVLSQGERQRIMIGRALISEPKLLILDEPCAGLDPLARELFLRFVEQLARHKNSPALVFVTHHAEEIMPVFSHVLALKNGKVLACGKKNDVMKSAMLSKIFSTPITLCKNRNRFEMRLRVAPSRKVV